MSLTQYPAGSFRELLKISFPLMLSSLSITFMVFVDRLLLAHYSTQALNAVTNAATFGWTFIASWMVLTSIAEVFVAQYNGAEQKSKLGQSVWQMIWLSLFSLGFFFPLALWGTEWIYGSSTHYAFERDYFKWMLIFGSSFPLYGALCGFFVGQGKTLLVTLTALIANLFNALLDLVLIFGIEGYLEPMGVRGAAMATSGSSLVQVFILGGVFLNSKNRRFHGTSDYKISPPLFWQCIKMGLPNALFVAVELLGFSAYYYMMTKMGERYITVAGISQSLTILLYFMADGVSKAATAVAGNLVGAKKSFLLPKVILSGVQIHLLFFMMTIAVLFFCSDLIMQQFLPTMQEYESLRGSLTISLLLISSYLLFEGVRLLFSGVLTALGDTFFLLIAGSLSIWALLVVPVYLFIVHWEFSIEVATGICSLYSFSACFVYYLRFRNKSRGESLGVLEGA